MSEPDNDVEKTIDRIIGALDTILVQHGRAKGLKIIERRFVEASLKFAAEGNVETANKFLEILANVKLTLGEQVN